MNTNFKMLIAIPAIALFNLCTLIGCILIFFPFAGIVILATVMPKTVGVKLTEIRNVITDMIAARMTTFAIRSVTSKGRM